MTEEQNSKCHVIIHTATASASAIAAGLAQIPGSDTIPITAIQITMIISLGGVFGRDIAKSAEDELYHNFSWDGFRDLATQLTQQRQQQSLKV